MARSRPINRSRSRSRLPGFTPLPFLLIALSISACDGPSTPPPSPTASAGPPATLTVEVGGETFELELAIDDASRQKGLSERAEIAADGGMLFVMPDVMPDVRVQTFWMKDCLVPIDIIYLDPAGDVIITRQMKPEPGVPDGQLETYSSEWPALFAIELRGRTLDRLDISRGDHIELPLTDLKRWRR